MVDNPFSTPVPLGANTFKPPALEPQAPKVTFNDKVEPVKSDESNKPVEPVEPSKHFKIVQKVLAEYNNIESDIPVNHPEYWNAKRNV